MIEFFYITTKENLVDDLTELLELKKFNVFSKNIIGKLLTM